jgi:hypothetical protein
MKVETEEKNKLDMSGFIDLYTLHSQRKGSNQYNFMIGNLSKNAGIVNVENMGGSGKMYIIPNEDYSNKDFIKGKGWYY